MKNISLVLLAAALLLPLSAWAASVGAPGTSGQVVINNGGNLGTANTPTAINSYSNGPLYASTLTAATSTSPQVVSPALGVQGAWWTGSASQVGTAGITYTPSGAGYTSATLQFTMNTDNTGNHEVRFFGTNTYGDFINSNDSLGAFEGESYDTAQFGLYNISSTTKGIIPANTAMAMIGLNYNGAVETIRNPLGLPSVRNVLDDGAANANMSIAGGIVVGAPTGGNKGVGTVNATNLYINGVAVTGGGGGAVSSVSNSDSTLTVSPTTGAVVASLALSHANTWAATQTFPNNSLTWAEHPNLSANQVVGALTATTPSGLNMPSCSGAANALIWTSGTGFGCNTISGGGGVSSVANSDGTLTISPTTGSVVGSVNLGHRNTWTASQVVAVTVGGTQSSGGTYTPNFASSNSLTLTFGAGNLTIANPSNIVAGQTYQIALTQDGTGSRNATWGSYFKWAGGTAPTLTTTASAKDIVTCWADTTTTLECSLAIANAH